MSPRKQSPKAPDAVAAAPVAAPPTTVAIDIPPITVKKLQLTVVGDSPLITHKWSEKAKKEMLDKQMKVARQGKEAKDPIRDYLESLYWLDGMPANATERSVEGARFGFPCIAFKAAAVGACRHADMKMTEARGAFHVVGELVEIQGTPTMREDMVRVGMGTADIRYRGEFTTWRATLDLTYNAGAISPAQIANLFNIAGFGVGVGEWRPEKNGGYGRFHVATEGE